MLLSAGGILPSGTGQGDSKPFEVGIGLRIMRRSTHLDTPRHPVADRIRAGIQFRRGTARDFARFPRRELALAPGAGGIGVQPGSRREGLRV
jgi:hypothetical protein